MWVAFLVGVNARLHHRPSWLAGPCCFWGPGPKCGFVRKEDRLAGHYKGLSWMMDGWVWAVSECNMGLRRGGDRE